MNFVKHGTFIQQRVYPSQIHTITLVLLSEEKSV